MAAIDVTDETFDDVINGETPVVIDFWAETCGPCKQMAPYFEAVAGEMQNEMVFGKVNIHDNPMKPTMYGVRGIPTLMLFQNGKMVATHVGALNKQGLQQWIKESSAEAASA